MAGYQMNGEELRRAEINHRKSSDNGFFPLDMLHKERKLYGVQVCIVSRLRGIRVPATV